MAEEMKNYEYFVENMWFYDGDVPEPHFVGSAIASEAGESSDIMKKMYVRKGHGLHSAPPELRQKYVAELGDVLFYLVKELQLLGMSLEDLQVANYLKLIERWDPSKCIVARCLGISMFDVTDEQLSFLRLPRGFTAEQLISRIVVSTNEREWLMPDFVPGWPQKELDAA